MLPKYPIKAQNATNTESTDVAVFIVPDGAISGNEVDISSGGIAIGDTITDATEGSVLFAGAAGVLAQDNTKFFWDDANNYLRIGSAAGSQVKIGETNAPTESSAIWMGQATPSSTNFVIASSSTNNGGQTIIRSGAYTDIYGGANRFWRSQTTVGVIGVGLGYETDPIANINVNIQPATSGYTGLRISLQSGQTADAFQVYASGGTTKLWNIGATGFMETVEITAPSAPSANGVRIYAQDNGAGKTQLMALFATGSAVQLAIEP